MKKRLLYLILPIVTLILEILPYGAVCNFMRPATTEGLPPGRFRELYSYFDLTPFGYANFAPLITAVITCIVLLMIVIYCLTDNQKWAFRAKNTLYVCAVFSLGPLVFGISFFSVVGALITASLIAELLLIHFTMKKTAEQKMIGWSRNHTKTILPYGIWIRSPSVITTKGDRLLSKSVQKSKKRGGELFFLSLNLGVKKQ